MSLTLPGLFPDGGTPGEGGAFTRSSARSEARLELDHVAVGVAQIDGRSVAPRAEALDHVALDRDGFPAQLLGDRLEVVAVNR
jgi:hypothetical protein